MRTSNAWETSNKAVFFGILVEGGDWTERSFTLFWDLTGLTQQIKDLTAVCGTYQNAHVVSSFWLDCVGPRRIEVFSCGSKETHRFTETDRLMMCGQKSSLRLKMERSPLMYFVQQNFVQLNLKVK
jgi:hypothetical protein